MCRVSNTCYPSPGDLIGWGGGVLTRLGAGSRLLAAAAMNVLKTTANAPPTETTTTTMTTTTPPLQWNHPLSRRIIPLLAKPPQPAAHRCRAMFWPTVSPYTARAPRGAQYAFSRRSEKHNCLIIVCGCRRFDTVIFNN